MTDKVERRLAAILAADMVGYSRLMEADEAGTIARQKVHRGELIDPKIAQYDGRIVKTTGDGLLVEFGSAVNAVLCAVDIQIAMVGREAHAPEKRRVEYRIGINLGDIVIDGDDILGDGVNIAARLEALAEPGGLCIADVVYQSVRGKLDAVFEDLGERSVKNIQRPVRVWRWRRQCRSDADSALFAGADQEIRFCEAADGTRIAYATSGSGSPLVKAPNWLNHLEYDWRSPIWRHLLREFGRDHTLLRFDQRGNGLSDRNVEDLSFEAFVGDLEAVVDANGLERFPLLGISQGCAISIAYAVAHPERVSRLVLYGGFASGLLTRGSRAAEEQVAAIATLMRRGWGQDNPAFRQIFTASFIPGGTPDEIDAFNELQRISTSPENAVRLLDTFTHIDVTSLAAEVSTPTLVLHSRGDGIIPFDVGRKMAAAISDARFVSLESDNHLILEHDPAWPHLLSEIRNFLSE